MSRIRVLLVDDHNLLRESLRALLDGQPDLEVVAEAETAAEARTRSAQLQPDVVVMDLTMPGGGEMDAIRAIRQQQPAPRVLALTMHDDAEHARQVLEAGGSGFLTKRSASADLLTAIRTIHAGRSFISLTLQQGALTGLTSAPAGPESTAASATPTTGAARMGDPAQAQSALQLPDPLTPRERQVLVLLARGHSSREAAEQLNIGARTVETHRARITEKLKLHSRTDLVRYAMEHGWLGQHP